MIDVQIKSFEYAQLGATTEQQKTYVQNALKSMRGELSRYEKEKEDIMADAQKTGAASAKVSRRGGNFSMSVVFFQIGIMLSSVSALLKRKEMWILGLICGLPALILLANGVLLFF